MKIVASIFCQILIIFLGVANAFPDDEISLSPNNEGKTVSSCDKTSTKCSIYVITKNGHRFNIVENFERPFRVIWHNNHLVEISLSCGSPCHNSVFVDIYQNKESFIFLPLAVYAKSDMVAYADQSSIVVQNIFQEKTEPRIKIERDFSPVASLYSAINKIEFLNNGDLSLSYLAGEKFVDTNEIISLQE